MNGDDGDGGDGGDGGYGGEGGDGSKVMLGGKDGSAAKRKLYDGTVLQGKGWCVRRMEKPGRRGDVDGIYNATKVKPLRLRVITYSLPNNCGVTSTTQPV